MSRYRDVLGLGAGTAAAARPLGYPDILTSDHFVIHFTGDLTALDRITSQTAEDNILGMATPEGSGNELPGYIELAVGGGLDDQTIAHELFHLIQFGIFIPDDGWLMESTAEWMGFRFDGFPLGISSSIALPDMSLDCIGDKCGDDLYETNGYSRWTFFEYLTERYGSTIVTDVFDRGATLNDPTITGIQLIADTIAAKGASFQDVFIDWTVANLTGSYTALGLLGLRPVTASEMFTGMVSGPLPTQNVAVNHLAARYLAFNRGDGTATGPCYVATLSLKVTYPATLTAKPYFYWSGAGGSAVPLSGTAGSVSTTVPWDTCAWADAGYLLLQNSSTNRRCAGLHSHVVDQRRQDDPGHVCRSAEARDHHRYAYLRSAKRDSAHADRPCPRAATRLGKDTNVASDCLSSGNGKLRASLGTLELGTAALRAGNNDVSFLLPAATVKNLRRTAGSNLLRLTSLSPQGAEGTTFTRRVTIIKAPPKKPKKRR